MFYFYDLNYDIIFEIKTIIITFVLVVTPSHPDKTIFFSQHNGAVPPAPSFIVVLRRFYIVITYRMSETII